MYKEQIKSTHRRFRQWQEQPFKYQHPTGEVHLCNNCGYEFTGNFCPVCSQKADMGRIGWLSVRQGVMDIWGLGTRSLLYSMWQLLLRPGHIIGDYLDGKRQVSFPPVKMLFIVSVIYSMVYYWFFPDVLGLNLEVKATEEEEMVLGSLSTWLKAHYSWFSLIMAIFAVVPTWVLFRYSPRHPHHSLPEGFFLQIFLAVLMIIIGFLAIPLALIHVELYSCIVCVLYCIYYIIVYKYLFGYGLWGTLWRSGFILLTVLLLMAVGLSLAFNLPKSIVEARTTIEVTEERIRQVKLLLAGGFLLLASMAFTVGAVTNIIATKISRNRKG